MSRVAIIDGVRSPFVKFNTTLKDVKAADLAMHVIREIIERTELDVQTIDHVIMGNGAQPADAPNVARIAALKAGVPQKVPAYTVQRNCAAGMQSISEAAMMIKLGHAEIAIAGGVESMSNIPFIFRKSFQDKMTRLSRSKSLGGKIKTALSFRFGDLAPIVGIEMGLTDKYCGLNMGDTAEVLAKKYNISREAQDEFSLMSHQRTTAAWEEGRFGDEVMTIYHPDGKNEITDKDNSHRSNQSMEALAKLRPYFDRKYGTVTPGNSSQITDGASAMVLMDEDVAKSLGYQPKAYVKSWGYAGNDPKTMGLGPSFSTPIALDRAGLPFSEIQLLEINEAFAAQVIANEIAFSSQEFAEENLGRSEPIGEIDREILNVNGGAISLGHPIGASGNRIVLTLMKEMERRDLQFGLATLCIGGGQGGAMIIERE
ncbi:MAG: thiolase family protein [Candidatus Marinimicrobia bacterium]|nr:thiolase family protein [Candidatus Neomarinimicrobiota bacterium]MCF7827841.1 thiolase family protein [Candidatus Neomarinimicrobiota bacterium]MCF7879404.1 thiolase family protein [Candidatus Neomarinimicrobiota bacterium]